MGGHNALGAQFAEHVAAFRDRFHERGWHDPRCAAGACDKAAYQFGRTLDRAGMQHRIAELDRPSDYEDEGPTNHFVNVVKHPQTGAEHVVDWTARQFDEDADYPMVKPLKAYKEHMEMDDAPAGVWGDHDPIHNDYNRKISGLHNPGHDVWEKRR